MKLNNIILGDCLEFMKDIHSGSIDMILADLPYGYLNRSNVIAWDNELDLDKLWEHYERIIKPNGVIVLTASQPFTSKLVLSNMKLFKGGNRKDRNRKYRNRKKGNRKNRNAKDRNRKNGNAK